MCLGCLEFMSGKYVESGRIFLIFFYTLHEEEGIEEMGLVRLVNYTQPSLAPILSLPSLDNFKKMRFCKIN